MNKNDNSRVNERIRVPFVLVIHSDGRNLGQMSTPVALQTARSAGLDLVEVSPNANPPVCRMMDYGKFRYEQAVKEKQQKKSSKSCQIKQIRLRPVTGEHDLGFKIKALTDFLQEGHPVQLNMKFEKREIVHKDLGLSVISDILQRILEHGQAKNPPSISGKMLTCLVLPTKK